MSESQDTRDRLICAHCGRTLDLHVGYGGGCVLRDGHPKCPKFKYPPESK